MSCGQNKKNANIRTRDPSVVIRYYRGKSLKKHWWCRYLQIYIQFILLQWFSRRISTGTGEYFLHQSSVANIKRTIDIKYFKKYLFSESTVLCSTDV
jgi:hypothetical protein